jgi:hypothetical protein
MTLEDVLLGAAHDAGVEAVSGPSGERSWERAGSVFATLDPTGAVAAFRLDPTLAAAARRTPDTMPSELGVEWVVFAPGVVDAHAADRAGAWFAAAARRAAGAEA